MNSGCHKREEECWVSEGERQQAVSPYVGYFQSRDWTHVSRIGRQPLNRWTTREVLKERLWYKRPLTHIFTRYFQPLISKSSTSIRPVCSSLLRPKPGSSCFLLSGTPFLKFLGATLRMLAGMSPCYLWAEQRPRATKGSLPRRTSPSGTSW